MLCAMTDAYLTIIIIISGMEIIVKQYVLLQRYEFSCRTLQERCCEFCVDKLFVHKLFLVL